MPTYDFKCIDCDEIYTYILPIDGNHSQECPKCGKPLRKKFTSVPTSFKGEGFYTTDKFTDR